MIPRYFCILAIKRSSAVITLIILRVKNKLLISFGQTLAFTSGFSNCTKAM